ncbi:MAG: hypothetical protein EZS28_051604, partial [Streblomastix strix]
MKGGGNEQHKASGKKTHKKKKEDKKSIRRDTEKLGMEIREQGYYIKDVDMDGNCFFSSCSDQLFGSDSKHSQLRKQVIGYMKLKPDKFE